MADTHADVPEPSDKTGPPPPAQAALANSYLLVVTGLGGEPYYDEVFANWANTMVEVATTQLKLPRDRVRYLSASFVEGDHEGTEPPIRADAAATKESTLDALSKLAETSRPDDRILIVLIGHGSINAQRTLFNVPGPDLDAKDFADALAAMPDRRIALVNTTPSSAPFVQALSAPNRIIITATSSGAENTHTRFADAFVSSFMETAADADKDRQISLLEAFNYSATETRRYYETEGELVTEHPQLDDNGDAEGSRAPGTDSSADGLSAKLFIFGESESGVTDTTSVKRLALQVQARRIVDRVESLKRRKSALDEADYTSQLEALLIELAMNRRDYRAGPTQSQSTKTESQ